jgi:hypothetical protein
MGRTLTFTYTGGFKSKIATITDPQGGVYSYGYSGEQVSQVTYPDGTTRGYLYTSIGGTSSASLLSGIVDENNVQISTYLYDANGNAYSSEWAGGVNKFLFSGNTG